MAALFWKERLRDFKIVGRGSRFQTDFLEEFRSEFVLSVRAASAAREIGKFLAIFLDRYAADVGHGLPGAPLSDRAEDRVDKRPLAEAQPRAAAARKHHRSRREDIGGF